jgi:hypothetical protein
MIFTSYYLWFLIDNCDFVIDDINEIVVFDKHKAFEPFVDEMMNRRI